MRSNREVESMVWLENPSSLRMFPCPGGGIKSARGIIEA